MKLKKIETGRKIGRAEMWKITHKRKNDTYVNDEAMDIGAPDVGSDAPSSNQNIRSSGGMVELGNLNLLQKTFMLTTPFVSRSGGGQSTGAKPPRRLSVPVKASPSPNPKFIGNITPISETRKIKYGNGQGPQSRSQTPTSDSSKTPD
ncbi:hypothetical protein VNO80_10408 [Phaseolus coccineus]|uniref:Uncharacterized protein n=1 Tax=Phaseolus coccineus TaxID=3886 RepID=A0AAN9NDB6_PHACN